MNTHTLFAQSIQNLEITYFWVPAQLKSQTPPDLVDDGTNGARTGDGWVRIAGGDDASLCGTRTGAPLFLRRRVVRATEIENILHALSKLKIMLPRPMPASYRSLIFSTAFKKARRLAKTVVNCNE